MKVGDMLFECRVGRGTSGLHGKRVWFWCARGYGLEKFCRSYFQPYEPSWLPDDDGWLYIGPFKTERAAERDLMKFEETFKEFLQEEFPGLECKDAPDPRTLS
jgi:hypothetical protein